MQSITVYQFPEAANNFTITNSSDEEEQTINGVAEKLKSQLFVNETTPNNYIHCRVVLDEVIDIKARALNQNIDQVIVQNSYEVYYNPEKKQAVCFSNKKSSDRIKKLFDNSYKLKGAKYEFVLDNVINEASNVKKAQFTNLTIQTINGSMLNGNQVDQTEMYDMMSKNGVLSTIAVTYPFQTKEVSFSISSFGSIVLFSNLSEQESVQLVDELLEL